MYHITKAYVAVSWLYPPLSLRPCSSKVENIAVLAKIPLATVVVVGIVRNHSSHNNRTLLS